VKGSVAVIGGGVTGMVASLDLADLGFRVYLVENKPSIGGVMSQLDKTFPTLDCSMCTLAPRMVEVARHPNIELMTYSEVEGIEGSVGDFRLKVRRKATFIDWDKCTGCGACAEACIAKVPNEYDDGMSTRGAAYVMFPQAIPMRAVVDRETCLDCKKKKCEEACRADAFDWEMEDKTLELEVGSVVVATGFEQLDASILGEYGWGVHPNVITALQLERLLNASGPTEGNVVKSDGSHPDHIAFILCAGSRDEKRQPYCSRVCCMYSVKEAILVREHDPSVECTVFYMDMRAFGKNQEEFFNRARDEFGINFIRSKPSNVMRHGDRLRIKYEDTDTGEAKTLEADMVTLATAMVPKTGVAETLGLKVDNYGFLKSGEHPVLSSKPGVFIAGAAEGPRDISDSVAMASSAAAHVSAALRSSRNTETIPWQWRHRRRLTCLPRCARPATRKSLRRMRWRRWTLADRSRASGCSSATAAATSPAWWTWKRSRSTRKRFRGWNIPPTRCTPHPPDVHLLRGKPAGDSQCHRRAQTEPRHRSRLHTANPRAPFPRDMPPGRP